MATKRKKASPSRYKISPRETGRYGPGWEERDVPVTVIWPSEFYATTNNDGDLIVRFPLRDSETWVRMTPRLARGMAQCCKAFLAQASK